MIDWVPVKAMADIALDVTGLTIEVKVKEVQGYFHGASPGMTN